MRCLDLMIFSSEMLKRLHECGIRIDDYKYLPMLVEYEDMMLSGEKKTYVVASLSEKYGMCERKFYKVIARLMKDCQIRSV